MKLIPAALILLLITSCVQPTGFTQTPAGVASPPATEFAVNSASSTLSVVLGASTSSGSIHPTEQHSSTTEPQPQPSPLPSRVPTSSRSTTLLTGVPASVPVAPPRGGWQLVFEDEFGGPGLDQSKWTPSFWWGNLRDEELQAYSPDNLEFEDGLLRLRVDVQAAAGRSYTSGMISSHGKFSQQYGRFELRARVPAGRGLWPAFWLALDRRGGITWPPEIDIMEIIGGAPRVLHMAQHFINANGQADLLQSNYNGPDLSKGFHVYALEWNPDVTIWYIDGVALWRSATRVKGDLYMVVNLAVGDWAGHPDASTPFPSYLDIDYVRAYQKK